MSFAEIIGHERARDVLRRGLRDDRIPHALLLVGPEGVGKTTLARTFAAAILCEAGGDDGCGRCRACARVAHGNHPDFLVVTREVRNPKAAGGSPADADDAELRSEIVVAQIREMNVHAGYPPREGPRRIVLIDPADRMNGEAQNALLKTLEEPPPRTVLILTASRAHGLLATVRSRCFSLPLTPVDTAALATALEARGLPRDEAAARAALSGGLPGQALELDLDDLVARRDALLDDLEELAASTAGLGELVDRTSRITGRDAREFEEALDLAGALLRDAARAASGAGEATLRHVDIGPRLLELGRRLGAPRAAALVEATEEMRRRASGNANRTYLAEAFLAAVAGGPIPGGRA